MLADIPRRKLPTSVYVANPEKASPQTTCECWFIATISRGIAYSCRSIAELRNYVFFSSYLTRGTDVLVAANPNHNYFDLVSNGHPDCATRGQSRHIMQTLANLLSRLIQRHGWGISVVYTAITPHPPKERLRCLRPKSCGPRSRGG